MYFLQGGENIKRLRKQVRIVRNFFFPFFKKKLESGVVKFFFLGK